MSFSQVSEIVERRTLPGDGADEADKVHIRKAACFPLSQTRQKSVTSAERQFSKSRKEGLLEEQITVSSHLQL